MENVLPFDFIFILALTRPSWLWIFKNFSPLENYNIEIVENVGWLVVGLVGFSSGLLASSLVPQQDDLGEDDVF